MKLRTRTVIICIGMTRRMTNRKRSESISAPSSVNGNQPLFPPSLTVDCIQHASRDELIKMVSTNQHFSFLLFPSCDFNVDEGIIELNESKLMSIGRERVVVVDVRKKEVIRVDGADLSGIVHDAILDLSVDGDRWEGDVLNGEPCGWGVLFNGNDERVYEGFRIGEVNVCYGVHYYSDLSMVEYEGELCKGMRCGRGVQYDRTGVVVYDGEWSLNERLETTVTIPPENGLFHNRVEELIVSDGYCSRELAMLDVRPLPFLKSLNVGDNCFKGVKILRLVELSALESVVIGEDSFTKDGFANDPNRFFLLTDCPSLRQLRIGSGSFCHFAVCEIQRVNALEVIQMGDTSHYCNCFYRASLELKSLIRAEE